MDDFGRQIHELVDGLAELNARINELDIRQDEFGCWTKDQVETLGNAASAADCSNELEVLEDDLNEKIDDLTSRVDDLEDKK